MTGYMFTQSFVPANSPWIGSSSAQSSTEGIGTAGTTLFLTESAIFVDRFVPRQQSLPLSFASGVQQTSFSSVFLLLHVHAPLYSRWTGVCIYTTCALRQTPHGHMRGGVLGSVCNALTTHCDPALTAAQIPHKCLRAKRATTTLVFTSIQRFKLHTENL